MTYMGSSVVFILQRCLTPLLFCPNIASMSLMLGAFHGTGAGIVLVSLMVVLGEHFDKYLAVASGLRDAGTTLCACVFPSLLSVLNYEYHLRGTLLVYSALSMHVTVVALFLWTRLRDREKDTHLRAGVDNDLASFGRKFAILKASRFYVVVLGATVEIYCYNMFLETIQAYAIDKGAPRRGAEMAITYATVAEIVEYVGVPLIADMKVVSRPTLMTACFVMLTPCYALMPHSTWLVTYVVVSTLLLTFIAAASSMRCSLMTEFFGAAQVPLCMAAVGLLLVPVQLSSPMIIAFFRGSMGSYDNMYRLMAVLHFGIAVLFACLAVHERRRSRLSLSIVSKIRAQVTNL
ncbi:hypothetical protein V5799_020534 [Amblyomma americanum]|uniref:Monocarboxylate transporter n=1 Tax=Amblyomma americanum TaxID=6943 RepID=A0AAQ4EU28_AMBAM